MKTRILLAFLLSLICVPACADEPVTNLSVVLLQPGPLFSDRVPDISGFADYIKTVQGIAQANAARDTRHTRHSGFIVLAVRPNHKSHVWLDFTPPLPHKQEDALIAAILRTKPCDVQGGTVVFALRLGIWGPEPEAVAPSPAEWSAASKKAGRPMEIGQFVDTIWRE